MPLPPRCLKVGFLVKKMVRIGVFFGTTKGRGGGVHSRVVRACCLEHNAPPTSTVGSSAGASAGHEGHLQHDHPPPHFFYQKESPIRTISYLKTPCPILFCQKTPYGTPGYGVTQCCTFFKWRGASAITCIAPISLYQCFAPTCGGLRARGGGCGDSEVSPIHLEERALQLRIPRGGCAYRRTVTYGTDVSVLDVWCTTKHAYRVLWLRYMDYSPGTRSYNDPNKSSHSLLRGPYDSNPNHTRYVGTSDLRHHVPWE